jgi:hypothetical protein
MDLKGRIKEGERLLNEKIPRFTSSIYMNATFKQNKLLID